jgi:hypothetical protein
VFAYSEATGERLEQNGRAVLHTDVGVITKGETLADGKDADSVAGRHVSHGLILHIDKDVGMLADDEASRTTGRSRVDLDRVADATQVLQRVVRAAVAVTH